MPFILESRGPPDPLVSIPETADEGAHEIPLDTGKGIYHRRDIKPEKLGKKKNPRALRLVAARKGPRADISNDPAGDTDKKGSKEAAPAGAGATSKTPSAGHPRTRKSPTKEDTGTEKMVLESQKLALDDMSNDIAASPPKESGHMWVAILLALILGGLLFFGIYVVATYGKDARPPENGVIRTP
jgi:hypothetical protein